MCVVQRSKVLYIDRVYRVSPDASLYTLYIATHDNASSAVPPARPVRSLLLVLGRHKLGDRLQLDVGRALVDGADLGVAVELLDAVVLGEAHAAEPVCSKAVESTTLEAASSGIRGRGWTPNGTAPPPGSKSHPEPPSAPRGGAGGGALPKGPCTLIALPSSSTHLLATRSAT